MYIHLDTYEEKFARVYLMLAVVSFGWGGRRGKGSIVLTDDQSRADKRFLFLKRVWSHGHKSGLHAVPSCRQAAQA